MMDVTASVSFTAPATEGRTARLLVVDDQPVNIQAIYEIFAGSYEVFMATSGEQALNFCRNTPPDLVLLDRIMPEMDGLEVCHQLKQQLQTRHIPVIFVTASGQTDEEMACWAVGAADFVTKPVNPVTLRKRVEAHLALARQADRMRDRSAVDSLTGIASRRYFDSRFKDAWRHSMRTQLPVSLILADIDFFKRYNEHYGHARGDACLRQIALAFKDSLKRAYDIVARFGGEEFICLLPETPLEGAEQVASTLANAVQTLAIEHLDNDGSAIVTISLGVCSQIARQAEDHEMLIKETERQLRHAKQQGRRQVCSISA